MKFQKLKGKTKLQMRKKINGKRKEKKDQKLQSMMIKSQRYPKTENDHVSIFFHSCIFLWFCIDCVPFQK